MRILMLDDIEIRHEGFRRILKAAGGKYAVTHVYSYEDAIDAMQGERFDVMFLDHDLGADRDANFVYAGGAEQDGCSVVQWIVEHLPKEKHPFSVIVHSHNEVCGPRMANDLLKAGIAASWKKFKAPKGFHDDEPGMGY